MPVSHNEPSQPLFSGLTEGGLRNYLDTLRGEAIGGILLIVGAVIALIWANSPWSASYEMIRDFRFGIDAWHLDLTVGQWAADGLLAFFFFVVGLELKREIVTGELRRLSTAIVPVAAAVGGMAVPAAIYLAINLTSEAGSPHGWAIPTATDIAFAVAILSIVGRRLPTALRAFLLTLAVVDDLLAILIIAVAYTDGLTLAWLAAAAACVLVFALLLRRGITSWYLLIPLGVATWVFMHSSGIHATIAGVALGMVVPALPLKGKASARRPANLREGASMAEVFEYRWRPFSAGFAVPVFALFTAGVAVDPTSLGEALRDPVAQGVALGLVLGKPIGITAATWLISRFRHVNLAPGLGWADVLGVGVLAGIGFTVSLLVAELAFGVGAPEDEHAKIAVLAASLVAAVLGAMLLLWRGRVHEARGEPAPEQD
ncbi:Na+/H+ antiporter NhaA [Occultella glacieicola]|uniref:Na(+)/H(+) antiporter NhaA n=1 Tax=Occultella glacieicola TaxID=2518684 RepID=A0ABY2E6A2_9MICO|nr:Na+/H+ antiporter NhaA [Occultella glacieicola]